MKYLKPLLACGGGIVLSVGAGLAWVPAGLMAAGAFALFLAWRLEP